MQVQTRVKTSLHVLVGVALVAGGLSLAAAGTLAVGKAVQKKTVAKSKATTLQTVCGFAPYVADYVVTSTPTAPNHYTLPSLALTAASTQGDLNGNGTIEICLRSGTPTAPKVYTESAKTTVNMNTWSVSAGTGLEPVRIFSDGTPEGTRWTNPTDRVLEVDNTMSNIPARDFTIDHIGFFNGVGAIVMASGGAKHLILDHDIFTGHEQVALWFTGNESKATITNSQITDNKSMTGPAGILAGQFASVTMESNGFYKNIGNEGTAITITDDAGINDTGSTFQGNVAHGNAGGFGGGAVAVFDDAFFGGTNSIFNTNKASGTAVNFSSGQGGAVTIGNDADFSCTGCVWDGNTSTVAGGAISTYSTHGMNLGQNTFTNNSSVNAGALHLNNSYATGHVITGGTFQNNSAINDGGAISAMLAAQIGVPPTGTLTINGTTFNANTAGNVGGAINMPLGELQIDGATFTQNIASGGGGIFKAHEGPLTLTNTTFTGNQATATSGGAMFVGGSGQSFVTSMNNMTFVGNMAQNDGGAVYGQDYANITINNSTLHANNASVMGGAVGIGGSHSDLAVQNSFFAANSTTSTSSGRGGAVGCYAGNAGMTVQLVNNNFDANTSGLYGGAVASFGCDLLINSTTFGTSLSRYGGAVSMNTSPVIPQVIPTLTVTDSQFEQNASTTEGGAIRIVEGDQMITGTSFSGNSSSHGGAVFGAASHSTFTDVDFIDNIAINEGGAVLLQTVFAWRPAVTTMDGVNGFGNSSGFVRGFGLLAGDSVNLSHLDIRNNTAQSMSAGLELGNVNGTLNNSIFAGNTITASTNPSAGSGLIIPPSSDVTVDYITVSANDGTTSASEFLSGNGGVLHSIGAYNPVSVQMETSAGMGFDYNVLYTTLGLPAQNGAWNEFDTGVGNVVADPQFVGDGVTTDPAQSADILNFDFHLQPTSPAVDIDASETDVDGSPADAGAYGGPNGAW